MELVIGWLFENASFILPPITGEAEDPVAAADGEDAEDGDAEDVAKDGATVLAKQNEQKEKADSDVYISALVLCSLQRNSESSARVKTLK